MSVVFLHPLAGFVVISGVFSLGAFPLYMLSLHSIPALLAWPPALPILPGATGDTEPDFEPFGEMRGPVSKALSYFGAF